MAFGSGNNSPMVHGKGQSRNATTLSKTAREVKTEGDWSEEKGVISSG
jgi:hypothetical protein